MKKILSILLALFVVGAIMSGCSKSEEGDGGGGTKTETESGT
jgi:hypothetical protein